MKHKKIYILMLSLISLLLISCNKKTNESFEILSYDYGVFLGASSDDIEYMKQFNTIVIDAQYYDNEDILELKGDNNKVYSYLNVGSIEDFRDYYNDYYDITLSDYENWDEERWVDVTKLKWQDFIINNLSNQILSKGVDGLFIDNVDVYYHYETEAIFNSLTYILKELKKKTYISINGGDTYVYEYIEKYNKLDDIMDAENQETVFTKINWNKKDSFSRNDKDEKEYFIEYIETLYQYNIDIYLLEYTKNAKLVKEIDDYCKEHNYKYYASKTLELLAK